MQRAGGASGNRQVARRPYRVGPDGCRSNTAGLAARNSQASTDALRRIQKAKAAAKVKRYARHKSKMRLLSELERKSAATSAPIVAPELARPSDDIEFDVSTYGGKNDENKAEATVNSDIAQDKVSRKRKHQRDPRSVNTCGATPTRRADTVATGASTGSAAPDRSFESINKNQGGEMKVDSEKSSDRELGTSWRKKTKYQPFRKELAIAAARQEEREQHELEFQRKKEEIEQRQKESKDMRKKRSKQFRTLTSRGQPVMKHRIDALLERIQQG